MDRFAFCKCYQHDIYTGLKLMVAITGIDLLMMYGMDVAGFARDSVWVTIGDPLFLGLFSSVLIYYWMIRPQQLYRAIINNLCVGVVVTQVYDDGERIVAVNPAFSRLTGYASEDVLGQYPRLLLSEDADAGVHAETERACMEQIPMHVEQKSRRKDGSYFWSRLHLSPLLNSRGAATHWIGLIDDITEQKRIEDELIHAQRMEAVGALTGGIAHEFNNVLAAITGHLYLMRTEAKDMPRITDRIKIIEQQSQRAATIIRQMLTFARKGMVDMQVFDLQIFSREVVKLVEPAVPENIHLAFEIADDSMMVNGDAGQIQQCLLNLITNARHAIEEQFAAMADEGQGHIKLVVCCGESARRDDSKTTADVGCNRPQRYVEIRVEDNGCGMSDTVRRHIFEPYFTTKGIGRGTGLGLPMVFGCMQMHRGCIQVESAQGKGSSFSLYFPRVEEQAQGVEDHSEDALVHGHGEYVLVADDNAAMREALQEMLMDAGYHVVTATDGEDAIHVFREYQQKLTLAFLDMVMPRRNGKAVARYIKGIQPGVEVVLMTGYDLSDELSGNVQIGNALVPVIRKPWTIRNLNKALRTMQVADESMRIKAA